MAAAPRRRYTLRSLFVLSAAIAVPFLLLANLRNATRPDDSLASPLYLIAGVLAVLTCGAIGNALGRTAGMIATATGAALIWIALVWLCGEFSGTLRTLLPVHVAAAAATVIGLAMVVRSRREPTEEGPHAMLSRLLAVKSGLKHQPPTQEREPPAAPPGEGN
jgi:hypothetical protein